METQNQIKRTLTQAESIEYIRGILETSDDLNRTQLADHLCDKFRFFNPQGKRQSSGCLKAIRDLEEKGHFILPVSTQIHARWSPRRLDAPVPEPSGVPDSVEKIVGLRLVLIETEEHTRIWNELMIQDHPQGAGPFVGRQIRYLAQSEHG